MAGAITCHFKTITYEFKKVVGLGSALLFSNLQLNPPGEPHITFEYFPLLFLCWCIFSAAFQVKTEHSSQKYIIVCNEQMFFLLSTKIEQPGLSSYNFERNKLHKVSKNGLLKEK